MTTTNTAARVRSEALHAGAQPPAESRARNEIQALTGIRGVAAMVVFLAHYDFPALVPALQFVSPLVAWHNQAVDLFFILSGFVLHQVYGGQSIATRQWWRRYAIARIARIYPLQIATSLACVGLLFAASFSLGHRPPGLNWADFIANVTLVQNWPVLFSRSLNGPAWSLSVEVFCYALVFPVALAITPLFRFRIAGWIGVAACTYALASLAAILQGWPALGRGAIGCVIGCFLHSEVARGKGVGCARGAREMAFAAGSFLLILGGTVAGLWETRWVVFAFPLLVLSLGRNTEDWLARALKRRPAMVLGNLSYSIYLWHGVLAIPLLYGVRPYLKGAPVVWRSCYAITEFLIVLLVAWISFRFFETPSRRWVRNWPSSTK